MLKFIFIALLITNTSFAHFFSEGREEGCPIVRDEAEMRQLIADLAYRTSLPLNYHNGSSQVFGMLLRHVIRERPKEMGNVLKVVDAAKAWDGGDLHGFLGKIASEAVLSNENVQAVRDRLLQPLDKIEKGVAEFEKVKDARLFDLKDPVARNALLGLGQLVAKRSGVLSDGQWKRISNLPVAEVSDLLSSAPKAKRAELIANFLTRALPKGSGLNVRLIPAIANWAREPGKVGEIANTYLVRFGLLGPQGGKSLENIINRLQKDAADAETNQNRQWKTVPTLDSLNEQLGKEILPYAKEFAHLGLHIGGRNGGPVAGPICTGVNVCFYMAEGRNWEAGLTAVELLPRFAPVAAEILARHAGDTEKLNRIRDLAVQFRDGLYQLADEKGRPKDLLRMALLAKEAVGMVGGKRAESRLDNLFTLPRLADAFATGEIRRLPFEKLAKAIARPGTVFEDGDKLCNTRVRPLARVLNFFERAVQPVGPRMNDAHTRRTFLPALSLFRRGDAPAQPSRPTLLFQEADPQAVARLFDLNAEQIQRYQSQIQRWYRLGSAPTLGDLEQIARWARDVSR